MAVAGRGRCSERGEGSGTDLRPGCRRAWLTMKCTFSRLDMGRSEREPSDSKASSPIFSWLATWKSPSASGPLCLSHCEGGPGSRGPEKPRLAP